MTKMDEPELRRAATSHLSPAELAEIRALLEGAFGDEPEERFTDDDWDHALGGIHFMLGRDGRIITHAAVVERRLDIAGRTLRTGYVEAVATAAGYEGRGFGSRVMEDVTAHIVDRFELGALGTGRHTFYARLGWQTWLGPSSVRSAEGERRTPDDDGYIMVLRTPRSPAFELTDPISCEPRSGDDW